MHDNCVLPSHARGSTSADTDCMILVRSSSICSQTCCHGANSLQRIQYLTSYIVIFLIIFISNVSFRFAFLLVDKSLYPFFVVCFIFLQIHVLAEYDKNHVHAAATEVTPPRFSISYLFEFDTFVDLRSMRNH